MRHSSQKPPNSTNAGAGKTAPIPSFNLKTQKARNAMSNRMNYRRPVHQIHDRELENKYRERRSAWISTRVLMKAKRWQDIVDWNAEREYETARANGPAKYAKS